MPFPLWQRHSMGNALIGGQHGASSLEHNALARVSRTQLGEPPLPLGTSISETKGVQGRTTWRVVCKTVNRDSEFITVRSVTNRWKLTSGSSGPLRQGRDDPVFS